MNEIDRDQAQSALDAVADAQRRISADVGLPRAYWWSMAGGWLALGVIGDFAPAWVTTVATVAFSLGHAVVATRLLDGRRGRPDVQLRRSIAGRGVVAAVTGILLLAVAVTIGLAVALHADGTRHSTVFAAITVATAIGFGGPAMLATVRRWVRA